MLIAMPDDLPGAARSSAAVTRLRWSVSSKRACGARRGALAIFEARALRLDRRREDDPRRKGRELYVPRLPTLDMCAVVALERWLETIGRMGPIVLTFDLHGKLTANRFGLIGCNPQLSWTAVSEGYFKVAGPSATATVSAWTSSTVAESPNAVQLGLLRFVDSGSANEVIGIDETGCISGTAK